MTDWDAEQFYEENEQSQADFTILTKPLTYIDSWLSIVLQRVLHEDLAGYSFNGIVHTPDGSVILDTEQYVALLRIRERKDAENAPRE